ncbi:S-layer glycoprotein N-glycosyltransferase AglJ [Salinarchaeum sp. IM2453]|uniref:S-layer glycoprotein N-glycosyltransferase AglJ n=1 Tax=Salinarchaeum sp. IM2453 TaxID=2862870 RepID=UPI001C839CEB|nr:S-layer glycoprotein N-glycosyltransferase AglJ [Salinarchaeum sp. IM2453]QZA89239.1 S-layer glycoprotein N-glycosyltransferase AglJ [Salinarchaeum sp. IM2453]
MAEIDRNAVCVLIPTLNEAETIGDVIDGYNDAGYTNVFVIDGGSDDQTQEIASEHGARVVEQSGSGKGQAVREAFDLIDRPYVLMVDGDGTYRPEDADKMVEPLFSGDAKHVIGNRFADMRPGAMTRLNQVGNRLINWAYRLIHRRDHHDILSGYRAFTLRSAKRLDLQAEGFGIETEIAVECVREGIDTVEVPITYLPRPEGSETNLRPVRDGAVIIVTLYRLAKTNNPFFYFGSVGTLALLSGLAVASFVGYRWIEQGIAHEVLAVVATAGILLGMQLLTLAFLSDMVVSLHRDQRRRIERLEEKVEDDEEDSEWKH